MKLSVSSQSAVLLLSVLLALLVVSHGGNKLSNIKDQPVNSDQNDGGPQTSSNILVSDNRRNLQEEYNYVTMEWEKFEGKVPKDAVSISGEGNMYVCRNMEKKCAVGILIESKCEYEEDENVEIDDPGSFEVLVNKDDFDSLEWKKIPCTAEVEEVHKNAVRICDDQNLFVGRKGNETKFQTVKKSKLRKFLENFYIIKKLRKTELVKELEILTGSCKVLTVSFDNIKQDEISDLKYDEAKKKEYEMGYQISDMAVVTNNHEKELTQTVERSTTISEERRWNFAYAVAKGVKLNIELKAPEVFSMNIDFSRQTTATKETGFSIKDDKIFKTSSTVLVPPRNQCTVHVIGRRLMVQIPFQANLTRYFKRGEPKIKSVSGTFVANNVVKAETVVDNCKPLNGGVASAGRSAPKNEIIKDKPTRNNSVC